MPPRITSWHVPFLFGILPLAILLHLLSSTFCYAAPVISGTENKTKTYYYSSYPPDNPFVSISRTLVVTEPQGLQISQASVIMLNSTTEDLLAVSASLLTSKGLTADFFPKAGQALLLIKGNGTAATYQTILRAAQYQAPLTYLKTALVTHFRRNVTFQVENVLGATSNLAERGMTLDAANKVLMDSFSGYLNDRGIGTRFFAWFVGWFGW